MEKLPRIPRLIVVTGKGGVGKTCYALSLTKALQEHGLKAKYNSFGQGYPQEIIRELEIPHYDFHPDESLELYVGRKLNSKFLAHWVLKAPFFKAMMGILPSLKSMILLGHIIDVLRKNPDEIIVVDSPSSGHVLSIFESPENFRKIFKNGLLFQDILKMQEFMFKKENFHCHILALPTPMALDEALELKQSLSTLGVQQIEILLNDSLALTCESVDKGNLPDFIKQKVDNEKSVTAKLQTEILHTFPRLLTTNGLQTCHKLIDLMKPWVINEYA